MIERFDHAVIAVRDLDAGIGRTQAQGFAVAPGGRHEGAGSHNAIVRFGLDYLELLSVHDEAAALRAGTSRRELVHILRSHDGLNIGFALACSDLDALAARLEREGLEALGPYPMQRRRPDGSRFSWRLLMPNGSAWRRPWPFFIRWDDPDAERLRREPSADHPNGVRAVVGVQIAVRDLRSAADLYGRQIGLTLRGVDRSTDLNSERATYTVGSCRIEVLAPAGPGPVAAELERAGEGLFAILLNSDDHEVSLRDLRISRGPSGDQYGSDL